MSTGPSLPVGTRLRLQVGAVAHGGHCVARIGDDGGEHAGRVVFVRHTLPGETVVAAVTDDDGGSYLRADAVEVDQAAPGRVEPPCPAAGPGRCGGCDWQHADGATQRELKATVVREALHRFAGSAMESLDLDVRVEPLGENLLHWRTRTLYAVDPQRRLGLRQHRSHAVVPLEHCPLGVDGVGDAPATQTPAPGVTGVEVVRGDDGALAVVEHRPAPAPRNRNRGPRRGRRAPDRTAVVAGPEQVTHTVRGRRFAVSAAGFWQVHPAAAETFAAAVLDGLAPRPGERVLDLYAGAGLFTALLAEAVGPEGEVRGLEADGTAVADAAGNLADLPWAAVHRERVNAVTVAGAAADGVELVVLDPPRSGAGREVVAAITGAGPRAVVYVACDPVALARDLAVFADLGYRPTGLRAFDAFPMTHHVECVVALRSGAGS